MSNKSLHEIHESIDTEKLHGWRKIISFFGPALLVSIGYMDPGNWATDLEAGARFGYKLLFILLLSNLMALVLQSHSARLGIVRGKDLAQINKEIYPKKVNFILYLLAEIAIIATDLAEVLGMALGLKLLFGIDLVWGVLITFIDTLLILYLQKLGIRKMESFILGLIFIIAGAFVFQLILSQPSIANIVGGLVPKKLSTGELYISIGIIGATVMPHNLYLHSSLVQSRKIGRDDSSIKKSIKYNFWDSALSLNFAFFVNAAILILAASTFHNSGHEELSTITDAYKMLAPVLNNNLAPTAFAIALIAAGQSSTVTGTLAGQIVMEGYLNIKINPFVRQLITRLLAILPALIMIIAYGDNESEELLVFSQVILSLQLSFAIIPLIFGVSSKKLMGKFYIKRNLQIISWIIAILICGLNLYWLISYSFEDFAQQSIGAQIFRIIAIIGFISLLFFTIYYPLKKEKTA
ncbi:Nramp family divalent metal transporter [Elizabethkingia sp. JS20170427COW]|uniref:Nramp family divalent metal transporter n=1 Tax=Elizabethkingia sp. JS20170427COW TaxID=2583851 RepID=UPI001110A3A2|nr:Nramp family divalent metal transporter [Elizabethkingia sp. JS20170427COW]QCX53771.1 divalent metal cation transporter [Elizabethkingia sp. JS20170427COW]